MSKLLKKAFVDEATSDFTAAQSFTGTLPDSLLITVDATHAGYINRNGFRYDDKAMAYAVSQNVWTKPFEKPLLKNHDTDLDPLGRVVASRYIKTSDGEGFTQLDIKVVDKDAIQKIIDKRYLTVSTHGAPMQNAPEELQYVKCSICKTNILTADEWCGHMRGNVYENEKTGNKEKCFWSIGAMDYKEVSIVNAPADYRAEEGAAQIVACRMMDEETPLLYHETDKHRQAFVFVDSEVQYADESFLETKDAEKLIANSILWEAVDYNKEEYIKAKGLLFTSSEDCDKEEEEINWEKLDKQLTEELGDAKLSTEQRKKLKESQFCGPDRSFPVPDCKYVTAARRLIGRSKYSESAKKKILACVNRKAKTLGCQEKKDSKNEQNLKSDTPKQPPVKPVLEDIMKKYDSWQDQVKKYIEQLKDWDNLSTEDQQEILVYAESDFIDRITQDRIKQDKAAEETKKQEQIDSVLKSIELIK